MHGEIRWDPEGLRDRAAQLAELAKRVAQTHVGLRDCLAQADGSWGDDYMGLAFVEQFEPNAEQLLANVQDMEESLDSTAHGIYDAARQFESQDISGAAAVGTAAGEPGTGSGAPILPGPGSGTEAATPVGTRPPPPAGAPTPAANSAATSGPPDTMAGARPTERPTPGGNRLSDQPASEGARQPGQSADPARREQGPARREPDRAGRDSRSVSAGSAVDPGRRSPSSPVLPPVARRDTPATQGSSGHRSAADAGGRATPWSRSSPPASGPPGGSEASPRSGPPPRQHKPSDDKPRPQDRRSSGERPVADPVIGWLARELADRHGVTVNGFDTPGLQVPPVREFVGAVDRVLTDYPALTVDVVAVAALAGGSTPVRWRREPHGIGGPVCSLTLDRQTAQKPERTNVTPQPDTGPEQLAVYTATLREFGRALDAAGGGVAGRQAQRALIAEYMHRERGRYRTLGEAVRGYRDWRAELTGTDPAALGFDVGRALGAAFAECLEYGDAAGVQARTLHTVLVGAVSR